MNRRLLAVLVLAALPACSGGDGGGGGTGSRVAASVALSLPTLNFDAVGATQVVHASVKDAKGSTISGAPLAWASSSAAVVVASAAGDSAVLRSAANGGATVTATSGAAVANLVVQVTQTAIAVQKVSGDGQTGAAGTPLPAPLTVRVLDRLGAGVAGATVNFSVLQGGGNVTASAVSGADGTASASWTLGGNIFLSQQVGVALAGATPNISFSATAVAGPAAAITLSVGDNQGAPSGAAVAIPPAVRVTDAFNNPVAGASVTFTVTAGGGSVTGATQLTNNLGIATVGSWTLGSTAGTNQLSATLNASALPPYVFHATSGAVQMLTLEADTTTVYQAAMAGTAVPRALRLRARNSGGTPVNGVEITFSVASGGGSITAPRPLTADSGIARLGSWTLGPNGQPNTVTATVTGTGYSSNTITFTGVGCTGGGPGYTITLCFTTLMTPSQKAVFQAAADRWGTLVTADLPDDGDSIPANTCGSSSPFVHMNVDDLLIFAAVTDIDGPGGILGSAGPCYVRSLPGTSIVGTMRFDQADVNSLEAGGQLGSVILHEMGHVLGIGALWQLFGLLQNPITGSSGVLDTSYSGSEGLAGFNAIGGSTYTGGAKVPVENTGGPGTQNSHWRENVLRNELMTGYINPGSNPLSVLTVRSLSDMGYTVNAAAADAFSLTLSLRASRSGTSGRVIDLGNDLYTGQLWRKARGRRATRIR